MSLRARIKHLLHGARTSPNPLVRWTARQAFSLRAWPGAVRAFVTSSGYRTQVLLRARRGRQFHQTTARTWANRYPAIFSAARDYLARRADIIVLSFGCSTGEEVVTLRQYLPGARLVGAEINPRSLAICRAREVDDRITFVDSTPERVRAQGPYDAIFCMAVLQRTPHEVEAQGVADLRTIYPFEKFDRQLSEFDRMLRPGGLLVLHHTQYVFSDAAIARHYRPLTTQPAPVPDGPRFDRRGHRISGDVVAPSMWVKGETSSGTELPTPRAL